MAFVSMEALMRISGVRGVAVVDRSGRTVSVVGAFTPLLRAHLALIWGSLDDSAEKPKSMELHWEGGLVLAMPAGPLFLAVLAETTVNLGMLRLSAAPVREEIEKRLGRLVPKVKGVA